MIYVLIVSDDISTIINIIADSSNGAATLTSSGKEATQVLTSLTDELESLMGHFKVNVSNENFLTFKEGKHYLSLSLVYRITRTPSISLHHLFHHYPHIEKHITVKFIQLHIVAN